MVALSSAGVVIGEDDYLLSGAPFTDKPTLTSRIYLTLKEVKR